MIPTDIAEPEREWHSAIRLWLWLIAGVTVVTSAERAQGWGDHYTEQIAQDAQWDRTETTLRFHNCWYHVNVHGPFETPAEALAAMDALVDEAIAAESDPQHPHHSDGAHIHRRSRLLFRLDVADSSSQAAAAAIGYQA